MANDSDKREHIATDQLYTEADARGIARVPRPAPLGPIKARIVKDNWIGSLVSLEPWKDINDRVYITIRGINGGTRVYQSTKEDMRALAARLTELSQ
jgi:hypothetical protein